MPFKSKSQRRLCYVKYAQDIKAGRTPGWDCPKWDEETSNIESLPERLSRRIQKKNPAKKQITPKIYTGPKGGQYIIKGGHKVYLK